MPGFNNAMDSLADWLFRGNLLRFPKLKLAYKILRSNAITMLELDRV